MSAEVYLIEASTQDGEQRISEKARNLFKAAGFAGLRRDKLLVPEAAIDFVFRRAYCVYRIA